MFDERGNVVERLDSSGAVLTRHAYTAYGRDYTNTNPSNLNLIDEPWGFGAQYGYYTDRETNYIYCTFRYYDPQLGRWLNRDPAGYGGGLNLYKYCGNNPATGTDPLGLDYLSDVGNVFKGYGDNLNPVKMAEGVAQIASIAGACGFEKAGSVLAQGIISSYTAWLSTDDPREFGQSFGTVLMTAADALAPHATPSIRTVPSGGWGEIIGEGYLPRSSSGRWPTVPDNHIIVRGGTSPMPSAGEIFSGSAGRTLEEAASGVPHGTIRTSTAGAIREAGGSVRLRPEMTRSGNMNIRHVNVMEGPGPTTFGEPMPNPVPKSGRIQ